MTAAEPSEPSPFSALHRHPRLFLFLFSLLLTISSLTFGFIDYDDQTVLLDQKELFATPFLTGLVNIFTRLPREEPLLVRDVSWLIDSTLFGFGNPLGYHLGNVLLNALNTVLFFEILRRLTRQPILPLVGALVFAVLPVHAEPIGWVMGRKDLLSACFGFWAMITTLTSTDAKTRTTKVAAYVASIGLLILATLSKVSAVVLFPVLALAVVLLPYLRKELPPSTPLDFRLALSTLVAFLPHAMVSGLCYRWYGNQLETYGMFGRGPPPNSPEHLATLSRTLPVVWAENLRLTFVPSYLRIFSDHPAVGLPISSFDALMGGAAVLGTIAVLILTWLRRKDLFFFAASACCLLVPYLNLVYIGIWIGNRYLYQAAALAWVPVLILTLERAPRWPRLVGATAIGLLTWNLVFFQLNLSAYADNETLWIHETERFDEPSIMSLQALARVYVRQAEAAESSDLRQERTTQAERLVERGFAQFERLKHTNTPGYFDYQVDFLSKLYHYKGRVSALRGESPDKQLPYYLKAQELSPGSMLHNLRLADTYLAIARSDPDATSRAQNLAQSQTFFQRYAEIARARGVDPSRLAAQRAMRYER